VHQNHLAPIDSKEKLRDAVRQIRANFPKILVNLSDKRHSQRPAKQSCFDVFANDSLIVSWNFFKPITHRLISGIRAIKVHIKDKINLDHIRNVP